MVQRSQRNALADVRHRDELKSAERLLESDWLRFIPPDPPPMTGGRGPLEGESGGDARPGGLPVGGVPGRGADPIRTSDEGVQILHADADAT